MKISKDEWTIIVEVKEEDIGVQSPRSHWYVYPLAEDAPSEEGCKPDFSAGPVGGRSFVWEAEARAYASRVMEWTKCLSTVHVESAPAFCFTRGV